MPKSAEQFIFSIFPSERYVNKQCKLSNGKSCMYLQKEGNNHTCQKYGPLRELADITSDKESLESKEKGAACNGVIGFIMEHQGILRGNWVETVSPLGNYHMGKLEEIGLENGEIIIKVDKASFCLPELDALVRVEEKDEQLIIGSRENSAYIGEARIFFKG